MSERLTDEERLTGADREALWAWWTSDWPNSGNVHLIDALGDVIERIVAAHVEARLAAVRQLADDFDANVDWSSGRNTYGDNEAWESAARSLRDALGRDAGADGQAESTCA